MKAAFNPQPEYDGVPPYSNGGYLNDDSRVINNTGSGEKVLTPEEFALYWDGFDDALTAVELTTATLMKENNKLKETKVEVQFNRNLTMAEREHFRAAVRDGSELRWHGGPNSPGGDRVSIDTDGDSRVLVEDVAEFVALDYLNLFPVAAKTVRPRVRV